MRQYAERKRRFHDVYATKKFPRWDCSLREFAIDSSLETFDGFGPLVTLWRERARQPNLPAWYDFDFADFRGWHGRINLIEVLPTDPADFRFRLVGTTFVSLFREENTWHPIKAGMGGFDCDDMDFLRRLVDGPRIGRTAGPVYWRERDHVLVDLLYLPLASDGQHVDRIMEAGLFQGIQA